MLKNLLNIAEDITDFVKAPVEVTLELTEAVTRPIADISNEIVVETKDLLEDKRPFT